MANGVVVPSAWREAYKTQSALARLIKVEADQQLRRAPQGWYTDSRIKDEESFVQKIETGRVADINQLEDFFGAVVVVPLQSELSRALEFIDRFFDTKYRRPLDAARAAHDATQFRFNDIRLYGTLKAEESLPPSPITDVVFEIQVRTFFQHAWSSATHDLVYKHPRFSWSRSRVAAQLKAMVESAEVAMDSIDLLETSPMLPRDGSPESELNGLLDIVLGHWDSTDLPGNLKRMTETLADVCDAIGLDAVGLDDLLKRGSAELGGHPEGWTPYQCIIDYSSRYRAEALSRALRRKISRPRQIFVTEAVLARLGLRLSDCRSAAV